MEKEEKNIKGIDVKIIWDDGNKPSLKKGKIYEIPDGFIKIKNEGGKTEYINKEKVFRIELR